VCSQLPLSSSSSAPPPPLARTVFALHNHSASCSAHALSRWSLVSAAGLALASFEHIMAQKLRFQVRGWSEAGPNPPQPTPPAAAAAAAARTRASHHCHHHHHHHHHHRHRHLHGSLDTCDCSRAREEHSSCQSQDVDEKIRQTFRQMDQGKGFVTLQVRSASATLMHVPRSRHAYCAAGPNPDE
jgi:hypothetical protein